MLRPQSPPIVPEETRRVARAAFPKGTLCLRIADALGPVYQDGQFAALFPSLGQPAAAPGRLALAVVLQFMENLSDREAADAVRGRIDWKYALGLALTDPGFDHTVLSEFRTRLVAGDAGLLLLDTLLQRLQEQGLVKARGRQRTDSTHVLAAVRTLNRLERVGETLRVALNELATSRWTGCAMRRRLLGASATAGGWRITACPRPRRRGSRSRPRSALVYCEPCPSPPASNRLGLIRPLPPAASSHRSPGGQRAWPSRQHSPSLGCGSRITSSFRSAGRSFSL